MSEHDEHEHSLGEILAEAAAAAELETGEREQTAEEVRAHLIVRVARITAGVLVTLLGIALLPLPGPGMLVVVGGLSILAADVPFARRLLDQAKARLPKNDAGGTPKWVIGIGILGILVGLVGSLAFTLSK